MIGWQQQVFSAFALVFASDTDIRQRDLPCVHNGAVQRGISRRR